MLGQSIRRSLLRHRAGRAIYLLVYNFDEHHGVLAASAMAFDSFLSLIPLAAFAGYILHTLHEKGDVLLSAILRAPPAPVADLVSDAIARLSGNGVAAVAPVSIVAFLWTSSSGISTAMNVFENVFKSALRPWWLRRIIAIGCVIAAVAVIALVAGLELGVTSVSVRAGEAFAVVVPPVTLIGLLSAFCRIAVRGEHPYRRRRVLPGVLTTVALWAAVSAAFSLYVAKLARYATLYGGLAAVAIFLFWLWLLAMALLVGGEVNAQLDGIRDLPPGLEPPPPAPISAPPPILEDHSGVKTIG